MKDEEILKKAIEKAIRGGYWKEQNNWNDLALDITRLKICKSWLSDEKYLQIIFSRSFAKSFWGNETCCDICGEIPTRFVGRQPKCNCGVEDFTNIKWQYHQHKMLDEIQEGRNPLKYLEKFL